MIISSLVVERQNKSEIATPTLAVKRVMEMLSFADYDTTESTIIQKAKILQIQTISTLAFS